MNPPCPFCGVENPPEDHISRCFHRSWRIAQEMTYEAEREVFRKLTAWFEEFRGKVSLSDTAVLTDALKEIAMFGSSVPLGMSEEAYLRHTVGALRFIAVRALAEHEAKTA